MKLYTKRIRVGSCQPPSHSVPRSLTLISCQPDANIYRHTSSPHTLLSLSLCPSQHAQRHLRSQPPDPTFEPQSYGLEKKAFPKWSVACVMTWLSFSLIPAVPFTFPLAWFRCYNKAAREGKQPFLEKHGAPAQTCFLERYFGFYSQDERHIEDCLVQLVSSGWGQFEWNLIHVKLSVDSYHTYNISVL